MNNKTADLNICVVGAGNFGTVIGNIIAQNGYRVSIWSRRQDVVDDINELHCNSRYLPDIILDEKLNASLSLESCVAAADMVFFAIPSKSAREIAKKISPLLKPSAIVVSTTKGIEAETFKFISQVLGEELAQQKIAALSGPNIAKEIVQKQYTGTVIACADQDVCEQVAEVLHSASFRVYANSDIYGVEMAGALKNIYAILIGFVDALGLGDNTKSLLITRALAEMSRFAVELGANPITFIGLAGVGDLLVTCMSTMSRNYRVGFALGEGKSLDEAVDALGQVAEGVNTLRQVKAKSDSLDVYMPLVNALHGLLFEEKSLAELIEDLTDSERNTDIAFVISK